MNIVLLGPPGIGKGTYAEILSKKLNIPKISTGDIFREAIKSESEIGNQVKSILDEGKLVPDDITIEIVKLRLNKVDCDNGFILDGFPRTIEQAKALEQIKKIDRVLNFVAKDEVIIERISGRRTCKRCQAIYHIKNVPPKVEGYCDKCGGELYQRADQIPDAVKKRLEVYKEQTEPLIEYYTKKGLIANIDANTNISDPNFHVIHDCMEILKEIKEYN